MKTSARGWPIGLAALVAAGSFVHAACGGAPSGGATAPTASGAPSASSASSASSAQSSGGVGVQPSVVEIDGVETDVFPCTVATREPCYEHATHVANVLGEMVEVEDVRDQRSIDLANDAIASFDALVHEEGLRLLARGLAHRSALEIDLAADLLIPPLATLVVTAAVGVLVAAVAGLPIALVAWTLAAACLVAYVARGVFVAELGVRALRDLLWAPVYVAWKLAVPARRPDAWIRTTREKTK